MSDQQAEPINGETGTPGAGLDAGAGTGTAVAGVSEPVPAVTAAQPPQLAPAQEEPSATVDAPKVETAKAETARIETPRIEAPGAAAAKVDAVKPQEPRFPGKVMIMSPGDRLGMDEKPGAAAADASSGKRRIGAMAAVVALATVAGALGGALATAGLGRMMAAEPVHAATPVQAAAPVKDAALEASVARIDAEIAALKAGLEHNSKLAAGQFNKASDRLDKIEKAQIEPAAKLARLSETVDKLRTAQASAAQAAATPAAAKDVTGSVPQPAPAVAAAASVPAPAASPKPEVARLPTVEGWVLRDVANGSALIESRRGMYEVYAGDPVPGLGRVDAIRKQDGRWVVVTSKGLIVAR